ncbi:hypothetical protein [Tamlana sp. I1]|uniref:hypothetical protein n=1 Tax=Tamlana sp. I1 TaxID=2762061 RepID=UPI00188F69F7|nr:hypothetical protein [Tamlana sp. I1]
MKPQTKLAQAVALQMKSIIPVILAFTILLKPLWPVLEYVSNYDYIATVLCENTDKPELACNGKCYLTKQLAKEAQESEETPNKSQNKIESHNILFQDFEANYNLAQPIPSLVKHTFSTSQELYSKVFITTISPPPQIA